MMASAKRVSTEAYEDLCRLIQHWNENRLELFEISMPNENLEFEGIMRFYFQTDSSSKVSDTEKVATKCIRVSNSATTDMVIKSLVQKFRPDMRMLTNQSYALYEVHSNHGTGDLTVPVITATSIVLVLMCASTTLCTYLAIKLRSHKKDKRVPIRQRKYRKGVNSPELHTVLNTAYAGTYPMESNLAYEPLREPSHAYEEIDVEPGYETVLNH